MGWIATIAIAILAISFMVFVTFFGRLPAFRNTPISFLHRLTWVHTPNAIYWVDKKATGGRVTSSMSRFSNHMLYDRHPTILIFFLVLLVGGEYLFLPSAWPRMSLFHRVAGGVASVLPFVFLYLAAATDPGSINADNHLAQMSLYPYDYSIFHPGQPCRTCGLLKPARSKHCSICKRCVAKCDHHCIFINNCVGYRNQHWFLLLLLTTGALTAYGAGLGLSLTTSTIRARFPHWSLWPADMSLNEYLIAWSYGLQDSVGMGSVTLLAAMTSPLVWGMLLYHTYLIWAGTTTNETLKWGDLQADMADGFAFRRRMPEARRLDLRVEAATSRWPLRTAQIVVRTEDGLPPTPPERGGPIIPGEGEWERVWKMRDIENLYDLGFWDNLLDVFVPNYDFNEDQRDPPTPQSKLMRRKRKKARASRFL